MSSISLGRPVARQLRDQASGPAMTGARRTFVNGRPILRRGDMLAFGGVITEGDPDILVEGRQLAYQGHKDSRAKPMTIQGPRQVLAKPRRD